MNEQARKARQFCLDVRTLAEKYGLSFFVVTEGASAMDDYGCPAVAHARQCHMEWEKSVGIDPEHDWSGELEGRA